MQGPGPDFLGITVDTWAKVGVATGAVVGVVGIALHGWAFARSCSQRVRDWKGRRREQRDAERNALADQVRLERWPITKCMEAVSLTHGSGEHGFHIELMKAEANHRSEFVGKFEWRNPGPREIMFRATQIEVDLGSGQVLKLPYTEQVILAPESVMTMLDYLRIRLQPSEEAVLAKALDGTIRPSATCHAIHALHTTIKVKLEKAKEHSVKEFGLRTLVSLQDYRN